MKVILTLVMAFYGMAANGQDFYCVWNETIGGGLKVDLTNNLLCKNGGPPREDYCTDQWATAYPLVRVATGEVEVAGVSTGFTEYVAQSSFVTHKYLIIRVYDHVYSTDEYNSGVYQNHRADFLGHDVLDFVTLNPLSDPAEGEPICVRKQI